MTPRKPSPKASKEKTLAASTVVEPTGASTPETDQDVLSSTSKGTPSGTTLTKLEHSVLSALFDSSGGNGHDFGFVEDCRKTCKANQLGGVISSLSKKGIIAVHDPVTTDSGRWTQTTWREPWGEASVSDLLKATPAATSDVESVQDILARSIAEDSGTMDAMAKNKSNFNYTNPTHFVRLLALRSALSSETKGFQIGNQKASKTVGDEFGFKGKPIEILSALEDMMEGKYGHDLAERRYTPRVATKAEIALLKEFAYPDTHEEYQDDQAQWAMMLEDFEKTDYDALSSAIAKGFVSTDSVNDEYNVFYLTEKGFELAVSEPVK